MSAAQGSSSTLRCRSAAGWASGDDMAGESFRNVTNRVPWQQARREGASPENRQGWHYAGGWRLEVGSWKEPAGTPICGPAGTRGRRTAKCELCAAQREECAEPRVAQIESRPNEHSQRQRRREARVSHAHMRGNGSAQISRGQHGPEHGGARNGVQRRAANFDRRESQEKALRVTEFADKLLHHLRRVRDF